jgi:hypothetical protein
MPRISFSDTVGIAGIVLAVILVVLDKAGKLKGHWLFILLAVAAVMTLFIALGNSWVMDAPQKWGLWRGALLFCVTAFAYSGIALWISPSKPELRDNGREMLTIGDQVKATVKPSPAIKTEVHRAPSMTKTPEETAPLGQPSKTDGSTSPTQESKPPRITVEQHSSGPESPNVATFGNTRSMHSI